MSYAILKNDEFIKMFKNALSLYLYLRMYIVRGDMPGDKYNIKRKYYDKGFLACSFSYRIMSKNLYMSHNTIRKYLHNLERAGIIKINTEYISEKNSINVFILGTWKSINENILEGYYIDEKYGGVSN